MGDCCSQEKHSKLVRATWGKFGKNEIGIKASSDELIRDLIRQITPALSKYKVVFLDKYRIELENLSQTHLPQDLVNVQFLLQGYAVQFEANRFPNEYHVRSLFEEQDLVLVNANHFPCEYVVAITEQKNVTFIDNSIFQINEIERFTNFITSEIEGNIPKLNGLVLAGGKSTRMGADKGLLDYHGKPQREYVYDLLSGLCEEIYFSVRAEQQVIGKNVVEDRFVNMGPMGGILSALMTNPERAWLVVACDLPLVDSKTLQFLVNERNASKIATAFLDPEAQFPEPLIAIWEPKSYAFLYHFLSLGYSCPRKVLINSDIALIKVPDNHVLANANEPSDYEKIRQEIAK